MNAARRLLMCLGLLAALGGGCVVTPVGSSPPPGCGSAGQVCCAGNACFGGLICNGGICGGGAAGRNAYERCAAGEACAGGTACATASFTVAGTGATNFCTAGCTNAAQCPAFGSNSSLLPTCIVSAAAGSGQCYDSCLSDADCGLGTRCANIPGTAVNVCAPVGTGTSCGDAGQPCCPGNGCLRGLGCNGGVCGSVVSGRPAYAKCTAGEACQAGTSCIPSTAAVAGMAQGSSCTVGCPGGAAAMCPGYVAGAARQNVECVVFGGNVAQAQCFRLCASNNDCAPFNTTCTQFTMPNGPINICVPTG